MSQASRHYSSHQHRARDDNLIQKRILGLINEAQNRHRKHKDDAVAAPHHEHEHEMVDATDWEVASTGPVTGTPIGHLMTCSTRAVPREESFESLVHYDMHPLMDRNPLLHEHFYDTRQPLNQPPPHSNKPPKKSGSTSGRSKSLPPTSSEGRRRLGANFAGHGKGGEGILHTDSKTGFESEDFIGKYENKIENPETHMLERRHSGGSNSSSNAKKDRHPILFGGNESIEDFSKQIPATSNQNLDLMDIPANTNEYIGSGDDYNNRMNKKVVSYSMDSGENDEQLPLVRQSTYPLLCRLRTETIEKDDSETNFEGTDRLARHTTNQPCKNTNRTCYLNAPLVSVSRKGSDDSHSNLALGMDEFVSKVKANNNTSCNNTTANNNNPPRDLNTASSASMHRYSHDSLHGMGRKASNLYAKDVLPLPIEIPDNVADAEAFRRYLSVRRGAITSSAQLNQSFEKRKEPSSSYDSLGRRNGGAGSSMGVTPSQGMSQEASRRTASLSHAIMTLALLSASICQLRFLITYSHAHSYPVLNYFLIFISLILEVAAGIGYVMIARCSYDDQQAEAIHNYLIFALFIVAVSNVVLAAFAFDDHICEDVKKQTQSGMTSQQNQEINQPIPRAERVMDLRYMPLE